MDRVSMDRVSMDRVSMDRVSMDMSGFLDSAVIFIFEFDKFGGTQS